MRLVIGSASRKNTEVDKPYEDAFAYNPDRTILCVCDGVTRSRNLDGSYPNPSPAAIAAQIAAKELVTHHTKVSPAATRHSVLADAFAAANERIADLSHALPEPDYLVNDLPGCVATVVAVNDSSITYGHIGDTILIQVTAEQEIRLTSNHTAHIDEWVRANTTMTRSEQLHHVRKYFRNVLGLPESFGVLTGEPNALQFVEYGTATWRPGDIFLLLSDGLMPLFERISFDQSIAAAVRKALRRMELDAILQLAEQLDLDAKSFSDDKTLLFIKTVAR